MSARPPTVLHIITGSSTGGAERSLWRVCAHSDAKRVSHRVITLKPPGSLFEELASAAPTMSLGWQTAPDMARGVFRLRRLVRQAAPDVVQGWLPQGNNAAWLATRGLSWTRLFWNVRSPAVGSPTRRSTAWLTEANLRLSPVVDTVIFNADSARRSYADRGMGGRHLVIDNGYQPETWRSPNALVQTWRRRLAVDQTAPLVGYIGRCAAEKGTDVLVHLAEAAAAQGFGLLLVGDGFPDPRFARPGVIQHPRVAPPDLAALYALCDLTVLPSRYEGFPNAVAESLLCRTPVLCADVGDAARVLGPGGALLAPQSTAGWLAEVLSFCALPDETRRNLGEAGRTHVVGHFHINRMIESYNLAYGALPCAA